MWGSPQLLVVEDDADVREPLRIFLEDEGFRVETARDGVEALDWLSGQDKLSRAILLDLMMPICNG